MTQTSCKWHYVCVQSFLWNNNFIFGWLHLFPCLLSGVLPPRRSSRWIEPVISCRSWLCWAPVLTGTWDCLGRTCAPGIAAGSRDWWRIWCRGTPVLTAGSLMRSAFTDWWRCYIRTYCTSRMECIYEATWVIVHTLKLAFHVNLRSCLVPIVNSMTRHRVSCLVFLIYIEFLL